MLGRAEFSIAEGKSQRLWVAITKAGRRTIETAKRHQLSVVAQAMVGPLSNRPSRHVSR